jgi:serine/threonine-protein kinase HSL1 (negative regulator of Swe1 kinase)
MTVIEHGKRNHLSIARFTQEQGAASSFYKVVETLETILNSRGMLVQDVPKKKMMIKTLNS